MLPVSLVDKVIFMVKENIVSIVKSKNKHYPKSPFGPDRAYPEFSSFRFFPIGLDSENDVYTAVRRVLIDLELDCNHAGTSEWNPLKDLIKPGQHVVLKPNLVRHTHPLGEEAVLSMITHASVIRPIIDYLLLATDGDVNITICDVPLQQTKWEEMIRINGLQDLVDFYSERGVSVGLLDLRYEISETNKEGIIISRDRRARDPLGYSPVNLGKKSALMPIIKHFRRFEITDYGSGTVPNHHNPKRNEYFIPNTVLDADLFINIPKLKTHKKTGITFSLKNLIGINGDKSWLAHHRRGALGSGGDEYKTFDWYAWTRSHLWAFLKRRRWGIFVAKIIKRVYVALFVKEGDAERRVMTVEKVPLYEGSWYGNDTVWRCIKDLSNVILYADKRGNMTDERQRNYLCIGDGIIAGDKEGPMQNRPRPEGIVVGGFNGVYVDRVAASIMGFDYRKIPQIREGFKNEAWQLTPYREEDIIWKSNVENIRELNLEFEPAVNWKGHIERE